MRFSMGFLIYIIEVVIMENEIRYLTTADLEYRVRYAEQFDEELISSNPPPRLSDYLDLLLKEKDINRSQLITALNVERSYGYQILNGTRVPTRENILKIAIYSHFSIKQTQRLLTLADRCELYVRRPLDAKIVYCLEHKLAYKEAMSFIWDE